MEQVVECLILVVIDAEVAVVVVAAMLDYQIVGTQFLAEASQWQELIRISGRQNHLRSERRERCAELTVMLTRALVTRHLRGRQRPD